MENLTPEEVEAIEAFQRRRAWHERNHGVAPAARVESLTSSVLAAVTPLPGQLVAGLNIAHAEFRRAKAALAAEPGSEQARSRLDAARRQLKRIQGRAWGFQARI